MVLDTSINFQEPQGAIAPDPDPGLIHTVDKNGNPFTYHIRDLFPDQASYDYISRQKESFDRCLPELIQKYAGKYVLFEDGLVIDSDEDEDILLDRAFETDFVKQRTAIYCHLVPGKL
jgi:Family of unknown function (DUF5678)